MDEELNEQLCVNRYSCYRCCNFDTLKFFNIKRHLLRKTQCKKKSEIILLSDDQLLVMTLLPYHNSEHSIDIDSINYLSKSNIINNNKIELFNEIELIEKNKQKKCKYCSEEFILISDLKKHIITKCFYEELRKRDNKTIKTEIAIDSYNTNNITNNVSNNVSGNLINNNNNNYNLYINLPIPFEEDWDISNISKSEKEGIIISQYVFSRFLDEILKNEKNSNVIIDKENKSGMVYMDHKNKYIEMKGKDIIIKTMEKLYDQLNDIIDNNKESLKMIKQISKEFIHDKFNEYFEKNDTKEIIDENIYNTFEKNTDKASNLYKNIVKLKDIENIKLFKNNFKKKLRNRREVIDNKSRTDKMKECKHDDYDFLYDSDGSNKL
jgi:hypothetical protein